MSDLHYFRADWVQPSEERIKTDVCIYGGNSAGIAAAIETRRRGKSVLLLHPGKFLGGLTTGGLGWTDYGRKHVIGGLVRDFYRRVGAHYGKAEEFRFEPHVAAAVYDELLKEHGIPVRRAQYLDRANKDAARITEMIMLGGLRVRAAVFIDATYEGDLMAAAGVSFTVGREGNATYGETLNGIYIGHSHQFSHFVDPYVHEGDPSSGLLPHILPDDLSRQVGRGDGRVQAYNFRVCMTDDPTLKIDWACPANFEPREYIIATRWLCAQKDRQTELLESPATMGLAKFDILPHRTPGGYHKTDTNNHGAVSSDFIGANHNWPHANYAARETIFQAHVTYQQGFYWHVANCSEVPERYRTAMRRWGLPRDEFESTEHWPHQIYVREARRMIGAYVITEHDCRGQRSAEDSIGMGSYGMDSHNCSRFAKIEDGRARVLNEGDVQVPAKPYPIPYRAITPRPSDCTNLLVPVCLSSSHIAYGSARMEPVFMVLGQSAAIAACRAIDAATAVQTIDYGALRSELLDAGQILSEAQGLAAAAPSQAVR